ncbi:MAG: DNA polymerase/3'-5' exonuclease PolX [Candidatus Humimicrobiaceae bacterium]
MDKKEISEILKEISTFLELKDENPFKIRAYENAARALEASNISLTRDTKVKDLESIKGIGKKIAAKIKELIDTGNLKLYQELKESIPEGLVDMLKIPGLGPKKIKYLYENLGIESISELELACNENKLIDLPNFSQKTQQNILKGISIVKQYRGKYLYSDFLDQAEEIFSQIEKNKYVIRASIAGSMRRKKEIVRDIDIVASTNDPTKLMEFFTSLNQAEKIVARGDTKSSIMLESGIQVDIRAVEDNQYPYALHHFTGSKEHNTALRSMAKKTGMKINEYGIFKDSKLIKCKNEKELFNLFSMEYIPPELRENFGEIEAAKKGSLPKLIEAEDIKGIFHIHTKFSDGSMNIRQVCKKLQDMGMQYAGISDHSKTAAYANGVKDSEIDDYLREMESAEQDFKGFRIFKGIEADILADGSLDYSSRVLERFDFVIAAIHSSFNMPEQEMTERIIRAIENKYTTILAHPSGRILLARDPYKVNITKIINAAAKNSVDLELNASPHRLDLDWRMLKYAKEKNVKIFINPDAHHLENLSDYRYGVYIARKGWLEKKDVINTMDSKQIGNYLKKKKREDK